jgi:hypothetical protein
LRFLSAVAATLPCQMNRKAATRPRGTMNHAKITPTLKSVTEQLRGIAVNL